MSIIQEALRKAHGRYKRSAVSAKGGNPALGPFANVTVNTATKEKDRRRPHDEAALLILSLSLLLCAAYVMYYSIMASGYKVPVIKMAIPQKSYQAGGVVSHDVKGAAKETPPSQQNPPVVPSPALTSSYVLNGIMYREERAQAVINGSVVEEGDAVNGATVKKIERDRVVLNVEGAEVALVMR